MYRFNKILPYIHSQTVWFYLLSGLTSFLNYAFYPIIALFITVTEYGEVQFLTSLYMQLSVGFVVLNILSIVFTTRYKGLTQQRLLSDLNKWAILATLLIILLCLGALYFGRAKFSLNNPMPILLLGVSILLTVPYITLLGKMQGDGKFTMSGIISASSALLKIVFALVLVSLSLGTTGAISGIALAMVVSTVGLRAAASRRKQIHAEENQTTSNTNCSMNKLKNEWKLVSAAILSLGSSTALSSIDVVISKMTLEPYASGQYAAIATLTKIIFYAATPLMWLAIPLALDPTPGNRKKIFSFIKLSVLFGVTLTAILTLKSRTITQLLLGIDSQTYSKLIFSTGLSMTLAAVIYIATATLLCYSRYRDLVAISIFSIVGYATCFAITYTSFGFAASIYSQIVVYLAIITYLGALIYAKRL